VSYCVGGHKRTFPDVFDRKEAASFVPAYRLCGSITILVLSFPSGSAVIAWWRHCTQLPRLGLDRSSPELNRRFISGEGMQDGRKNDPCIQCVIFRGHSAHLRSNFFSLHLFFLSPSRDGFIDFREYSIS